MITAIWDNGGKCSKNEERYTVIKGGFVYFMRPDGTWDADKVIRDTPTPNPINDGMVKYEVDRSWMDKNQISLDFSKLPAIVQKSCEQAVYP